MHLLVLEVLHLCTLVYISLQENRWAELSTYLYHSTLITIHHQFSGSSLFQLHFIAGLDNFIEENRGRSGGKGQLLLWLLATVRVATGLCDCWRKTWLDAFVKLDGVVRVLLNDVWRFCL